MNARVHLYVSPHLDDAVLSCGGRMGQQAQAGERVRVVTVFAGQPAPDAPLSSFAQELHARWGLDHPVAARRREDAAALALLGVEGGYWPYADCIYRRAPGGGYLYASEEALFGEVRPEDDALVAELAGRLRTLAAGRGGALYAPLAVGRHVDHQVVRRAVADLEDVIYYEDYPYAAWPGALEDVGQIGNLPYIFPQQWQPEHVALSPQALEQKIAAIACYRSQLTTPDWADVAQMAAAVRAFAWHTGGDRPAERYWRLTV
jgi:LmbE family N-acetylglucosaminyl deacetylase